MAHRLVDNSKQLRNLHHFVNLLSITFRQTKCFMLSSPSAKHEESILIVFTFF